MTDEIKLGRLQRDLLGSEIAIKRAAPNEPTRLSFPASSEAPVERWFGTEILAHTREAVQMTRVDSGAAPLLFNHDWADPIGMIDGGSVRDGRMYVDAHLFDTARAAEVGQMIAGGLRNVSVGYQIDELTQETKTETYTATRWTPLEVSIVTVPADHTVGVGRQADESTVAVQVRRVISPPVARAASPGATEMAETTVAAGTTAATEPRIEIVADHTNRQTPLDLEKARKAAIGNLCRANRLDERYERSWIETGASLETVSEELLQILEERGRTNPQSAARLDMSASEVRRYSLMRALRAAQNKSWDKAGLELEANRAISARLGKLPRSETSFFVPLDVLMADRGAGRRDMTVAGVSGSNYLVATNNMAGSFIDLLRNTSVGLRLGVRRMAGLVGNVTIPKQTAGNTAYWLNDEGTQITESQPTLGQVALTAKNVAALTELSHQLLSQATPDAEQLVLDSIARDIALAVDVAIIRGAGSNGEPHGIVGTAGLGAFTGTSLAAAGLLDAQADVASANALNPGCAFATTPAVAGLLMARPELPSTGTTRMWQGNMAEGSIFGFRAMSSAQMSTATMLFGDWSTVILGEWGVLELMTNPFSDFTRGLTAVRGWYTCDVALRYAGAFSYSSSIT